MVVYPKWRKKAQCKHWWNNGQKLCTLKQNSRSKCPEELDLQRESSPVLEMFPPCWSFKLSSNYSWFPIVSPSISALVLFCILVFFVSICWTWTSIRPPADHPPYWFLHVLELHSATGWSKDIRDNIEKEDFAVLAWSLLSFFPSFLSSKLALMKPWRKAKKKIHSPLLLSSSADCLSLGGCSFFSRRSRWTSRTLTLMWARWQTCTHTRISTRARRTRPCWRTSDRPSRAFRCSPSVHLGPQTNKCKAKTKKNKIAWQRKKKKNASRLFFAAVIYDSSFILLLMSFSTPWVTFFQGTFQLLLPCFEKKKNGCFQINNPHFVHFHKISYNVM